MTSLNQTPAIRARLVLAEEKQARKIAETLAALPGIVMDLESVQTNIIIFQVCREDMSAPQLCDRLT